MLNVPKESMSVIRSDALQYTINNPFGSSSVSVSGGESASQWFPSGDAALMYDNGAQRYLWWNPERNRWVVLSDHILEAPKGTRRWFARRKEATEEILFAMVEQEIDADVLQQISEHANVSERILLKIADSVCKYKLGELLMPLSRLEEKFPEEASWLLLECFKHDKHLVGLLMLNTSLPSEFVQRVADLGAKSQAASHRNASEELLASLAFDPDFVVQYNVARNMKTPQDKLLMLAQSVPFTSKPEGAEATGDAMTQWRMLETVAENPNSPSEALEIAARNPEGKYELARHKNTPPDVLRKLADDGTPYFLSILAQNPKVPRDALLKLSQHSDKDVQKAARKNPNYRSASRMTKKL